MPELPEVETIKNAVAKGIGRCRILDLTVRNRNLREKVPADIEKKVIGTKILSYNRLAKYIAIELSNQIVLLWHMGMSGKVKIADKMPDEPDKHDHIVMTTENGIVIFNDPRRFGLFTYCTKTELPHCRWLKNVGLDPFDEKLNADYLYAKLKKHAKTPIKISLLDQTIIAGIGNIYASEILYESQIMPTRLSGDVSLGECKNLIKNTQKVLTKAIEAGGSTLRDYKKPDGSMGYFQQQHCVYGKTGQKCPNCCCDTNKTGGIKRLMMGGRSTFYCESRQK